MATGKVRIFELAKELGLSSKELIGRFEQLGLEAKNQLSIVADPVADLVRGVLLGGKTNGPQNAPASEKPAVQPLVVEEPVLVGESPVV